MYLSSFLRRHIGPTPNEITKMLKKIKVESLDKLIDLTIPMNIRLQKKLNIPQRGLTEVAALDSLRDIMSKNKVARSFIGAGYYDCYTPSVISRNVLENPAWYTPYTPYQAEISQGRLKSLFTFQTMITDLTGMQLANSSLLDESSAAAEAMFMAYSIKKGHKKCFFVDHRVHPQTINVICTKAKQQGISVIIGDCFQKDIPTNACAIMLQYPATDGNIIDYTELTNKMHSQSTLVVCATDLLALTLLKPPGEWGADIVTGTAQRFGVPLGFGGPHAAFLATSQEYARKLPGRIVGESIDTNGRPAYRMAMQSREQHIKRDKATSNICTSQALLANISAFYGMYHGPSGLKQIATQCHDMATSLLNALTEAGASPVHDSFFDTICVEPPKGVHVRDILAKSYELNVNPRNIDDKYIAYSCDETTTIRDIENVCTAFSLACMTPCVFINYDYTSKIPVQLLRQTLFLQQPIFNKYHSETQMMRYMNKLVASDVSLIHGMIPLGSCTMKLNAATEMIPISWDTVNRIHPFAPKSQTKGYRDFLGKFEDILKCITGFHTVCLAPNSGATGEYAGLCTIRKYQESIGQHMRDICLIPVSAHGTNPASAVLSGMRVIPVKCIDGCIDMQDLQKLVDEHQSRISALMVTYPSTFGIFEEDIKDVCRIIHEAGAQIYMDGANMNAQVGLCRPGDIGADVCHLNLHKTFCIPHGGGGPGVGPIGVAEHLAEFLPSHDILQETEKTNTFGSVTAAPYGSASILPISYMYCIMMGSKGLQMATQIAILNANYLMFRLKDHFSILHTGKNGFCAHEFIVDFREFKNFGVSEQDVSKRLADYNFHAPTMSWPVSGTMMIEPTESEDLDELERFCTTMISIRKEIGLIVSGIQKYEDSPLYGAPHTIECLVGSWDKKYSRETAVFPEPNLRDNKVWPTVTRVNDTHGDRNLVCSWKSARE